MIQSYIQVCSHFSISKPSLRKIMYGITPSSQKSSRATMPSESMFTLIKKQSFLKLVRMCLICSPAPVIKGFSLSGLLFKFPFDRLHVIVHVFLVKPCNPHWDLSSRSLTEITHLVSGLNKAQVLDGSSQQQLVLPVVRIPDRERRLLETM